MYALLIKSTLAQLVKKSDVIHGTRRFSSRSQQLGPIITLPNPVSILQYSLLKLLLTLVFVSPAEFTEKRTMKDPFVLERQSLHRVHNSLPLGPIMTQLNLANILSYNFFKVLILVFQVPFGLKSRMYQK
jgi:hypothetical protein